MIKDDQRIQYLEEKLKDKSTPRGMVVVFVVVTWWWLSSASCRTSIKEAPLLGNLPPACPGCNWQL